MRAIYIRTSTEDQEPENQINDCKSLFEGEFELYKDKQSAWKEDKEREGFNRLVRDIKSKKLKEVYVWDLDRIYRIRKRLISFFELCKYNGCRVFSYRQKWLEDLNNIPPPFDEVMFDMMLQIMGWLAEEESSKKSERIRIATRKAQGKPTMSYKGNKWGRKGLDKEIDAEIIKLRKEGMSLRDISLKVYYWDKNRNKRFVSLGYVHKLVAKFQA